MLTVRAAKQESDEMKSFFEMKSASLRAVVGIALAAVLSACGGGGGSAGTSVVGGGTSTTTDTATVAVSLSSTTVTAAAPATVTATVKNKAGSPIAGLVVKFTTAGSLGSFSAASALTDANGTASVVLSPASSSTTGADTVKATVTYLDTEYSGSTGFQLTATNVSITSFSADVSTLSAYGQANLTVVLGGTSSSSAVAVTITSSCSKGTLTPTSQTTTTGKTTFTFVDGGCGATATTVDLTIAITGTTLTKTLTLPVSSPTASSIGFVSATPSNIYLKGSGLVENSNVVFQVKDQNGAGLAGQTVVLEPTVLVGGLTLDGGSSSVSKLTDSDGKVTVRINSGTVPTPVRIKATLQGSNISTVSSVLAVAVGLPSQLNFSLAQGTINIEGYDIQGTANTYTIVASDRLGNPVPDGTAINFVTEGGQIEAIKQTALSSKGIATTTANFVSASPVPTDGRVTVVAYALGEKSFLDVNGNNTYDSGEDFQDLGDIFLDRKFDNYYYAAEDQFVSVATGDAKACLAATSSLLATDVSIPSRLGTCSQTWGRAYVRRAIETIFSTSSGRLLWGTSWPTDSNYGRGVYASSSSSCLRTDALLTSYVSNVEDYTPYTGVSGFSGKYPVVGGDTTFYTGGISTTTNGTTTTTPIKTGVLSLLVADTNGKALNPMAAGTTVSAAATSGLTVTVLGGTPVANTKAPGFVSISYKFDDNTSSGTMTVSLKSPSGLITSINLSIVAGQSTATLCN